MGRSAAQRVTSLLVFLAVTSSATEQSRWSRQISSYTADISSWIPLPGPVRRNQPQVKRQAFVEPRTLKETFPGLPQALSFNWETLPSRNYFSNSLDKKLYLQSLPPSAPQNLIERFDRSIINNSERYSQDDAPLENSGTETQTPIIKPVYNNSSQIKNDFSEFNTQIYDQQLKEMEQVSKLSTLSSSFSTSPPTTLKHKKGKLPQPPLGIFLTEDSSNNTKMNIRDVLASLKTANSIAVLDSVKPLDEPKVFIGPSSLQTPERFVKFELPYLSNIENIDKKICQLPFFVAPLSYNMPQGFVKIPLPFPHIGSVIINTQIRETSTQKPSAINDTHHTSSYSLYQKTLVTQKPTFSYNRTSVTNSNRPENYQSNYYHSESQNASPIKPETIPPRKAGRTTIIPPTKYPSQLLETHNPYSINQAFDFSTPLNYHSEVDEYKEHVGTVAAITTSAFPQKHVSTTPKAEELITEKPTYQQQSSPTYQIYPSESNYEASVQSHPRDSIYNSNEYIQTIKAFQKFQQNPSEVENNVAQQIQTANEIAQQMASVQLINLYQEEESSNPDAIIPTTNPSHTEFITLSQETPTRALNETLIEETYNKPAQNPGDVHNQYNYMYNQLEPNIESNQPALTSIHTEISNLLESTTPQTFDHGQNYFENQNYLKREEKIFSISQKTTKAESIGLGEEEENIVQTTFAYNRVRLIPGADQHYYKTSSTETPNIVAPKPIITGPVFDGHTIYKPESTTDATSSQEITNNRGIFRRKRPNYSYKIKGKLPTTELLTKKTDINVDSTSANNWHIYSRYSHRLDLIERYYHKKSKPEETEDKDSIFSINQYKPTYAYAPHTEQWSPKIVSDSFQPNDPNAVENKFSVTEKPMSEMDIITGKTEFQDILVYNNINNKQNTTIPANEEALVEQSSATKIDSSDQITTLDSILEEVMISLEKHDEDKNSANKVNHERGKNEEIPSDKIISSVENCIKCIKTKPSTTVEGDITTLTSDVINHPHKQKIETKQKTRHRGFWKKVRVRPVTTESIEAAETQYYTNTVNLQPISLFNLMLRKPVNDDNLSVTTNNTEFQLVKDIFSSDDTIANDVIQTMEVYKINAPSEAEDRYDQIKELTAPENVIDITTVGPGDLDTLTYSPDPTLDDIYSPAEPTTVKPDNYSLNIMDSLFVAGEGGDTKANTSEVKDEIATETAKIRIPATENTFIPEEVSDIDDTTELSNTEMYFTETAREVATTEIQRQETTQSSYMNPANIISTSISTEISRESEICFRGKCFKTLKDISR